MSKNKFGGRNRVLRGGRWLSYAKWCRPASRSAYGPGDRGAYIGFRLASGRNVQR